jgi:hypothetical protein
VQYTDYSACVNAWWTGCEGKSRTYTFQVAFVREVVELIFGVEFQYSTEPTPGIFGVCSQAVQAISVDADAKYEQCRKQNKCPGPMGIPLPGSTR